MQTYKLPHKRAIRFSMATLSPKMQALVNALQNVDECQDIQNDQNKVIVTAYILLNTGARVDDIIENSDDLPNELKGTVYEAASIANTLPRSVYDNLDKMNLNDLNEMFVVPRASDKSMFADEIKARINATKNTSPTLAYILTGKEELNNAAQVTPTAAPAVASNAAPPETPAATATSINNTNNDAEVEDLNSKILAIQGNSPEIKTLKRQAATAYLNKDVEKLRNLYSQLTSLTAAAAAATVAAPAAPAASAAPASIPASNTASNTASTPAPTVSPAPASTITPAPAPASRPAASQIPEPEQEQDNQQEFGQIADVTTDYPEVVSFIRRAQMSQEQGDDLIELIDSALNDPIGEPDSIELANAVKNFGPNSVTLLYDKLDQLDPTLGHKVTPYKQSRNINFTKPSMMQSSKIRSTNSGLVTPTGFGTSINSNIWNKPVITEFGFPFLNVSSDAISHLFRSKGEAQQAAFKKFKSMLKTAVKTYGGIWKAIYKASLDVLKQYANDPGVRCVANTLKVDGEDLLSSDLESTVTVTPINYYSVNTSYNAPTPVPREYLTTFYDVLDYTKADRATYLQYADGLTANEFSEEIERNNGIPPFYILVPKKCGYSKCEMKPTGVFGSFLNLFSSSKNCVMVKTFFNKRKGCFLMEKRIADALYADIQ